jgi:hypothetical protein
MYLRPNKRRKNGVSYEYWTLVETVRTERGPRQRIVGSLGKLPGLDAEERVGWERGSVATPNSALRGVPRRAGAAPMGAQDRQYPRREAEGRPAPHRAAYP